MSTGFSSPRIVNSKSSPTTQVITTEMDWRRVPQSQVSASGPANSKAPSSTANNRNYCSNLHNGGGATRSQGLLTPHASVSENLIEEEYNSAQSNVPSTPSTRSENQLSEVQFVTPHESSSSDEMSLFNTPRAQTHGSTPNTSSTDRLSYASVGVQTSLPYSSSYGSTTPSSPTSSAYVTPKSSPTRTRKTVPEYVREGDRLARELVDDLKYIAQEKRRLKHSLALISRKEGELKSLLIPSPQLTDEVEESDSEDDAMNTESSDSARRARFRGRPLLTPASSVHEIKTKRQVQTMNACAHTSATITLSIERSSTSNSTYISAASRLSNASTVRGSKNDPSSIDSALRVPNYSFAEGSSSASSLISSNEDSRNEALNFAPNPIRDPSAYFIWFDLETTDVVRPKANIRILEVALFITDKNYLPLDKGRSFLVHWPLTAEEIASEMPKRVREMHEKSGLLAVYASTPPKDRLTLTQVERRICRYLQRHDIEPNARAIMAGAGVAFDRGMVRQHMEKLNAYFSHQIFDTTTLWHFIRRKYNRTKRFSEICVHRALDDIMESSREAKLYSDLVLKPPGEVRWPTQPSQGI